MPSVQFPPRGRCVAHRCVLITQFSAIDRYLFKVVSPYCRSYQASGICSTGDIHIHMLEQKDGLSDNLIHKWQFTKITQGWFAQSLRGVRDDWPKQMEVRFEWRTRDVSLTPGG